MVFRTVASIAAFLVLLTGAAPVSAQLAPAEPRFRADTSATAGFCPSLANKSDGGFVVGWGALQDESQYACYPRGDLYGRLFDRNGAPEAPPFTAGSAGSSCAYYVRIGPLVSDGTVFAWNQWEGKYGSQSVAAKRSGDPAVYRIERGWLAPLRSGDLAAILPVYTSKYGSLVVERRHDTSTKGERFRVIRTAGVAFYGADAAETADGGMVVVWMQENRRRRIEVWARRFDADGQPLREATLVSRGDTPSTILPPAVAANAAGQFVVTWTGGVNLDDAMARVYAADGLPASPVLRVNPQIENHQIPNRPAMDERGNFVVLWSDYNQSSYTGAKLFARMFDARGRRLGSQRLVSGRLLAAYSCGSVLSQGEGEWVLAWGAKESETSGIYVQRFTSE